MAAGTKSFTTQFLIGAKFTGQKGFAQANKALTATQKTAMSVNRGIGCVAGGFTKLAGAIGVAAVAYKVLREAQESLARGLEGKRGRRQGSGSSRRSRQTKCQALQDERRGD